jgi:hypothetical protein
MPAVVQLGSLLLLQSFTAIAPLTGHSEPAGAPPEPLQMAPWMQYVASPSTETLVQVLLAVVVLLEAVEAVAVELLVALLDFSVVVGAGVAATEVAFVVPLFALAVL